MTNSSSDKPGVIAPPPAIAAIVVVAGLLLDWQFPAYVLSLLLSVGDRVVLGGLLMIAGATLGVAAIGSFRSAGTHVEPWKPSLTVVQSGIYRWLRNPMYVGLLMILTGLSLALVSDWMLVLTILAAVVLHYGVVLREERYLAAKFGAAYVSYQAAVPRYGLPL
jgi:protein-S-isoprenylcysteine O-methyltransferase Ste14